MTDEEIKKIAESLNEQFEKYKCFRHQFQEITRRCRLCDAKREAKEHFEYARKIYVTGDY